MDWILSVLWPVSIEINRSFLICLINIITLVFISNLIWYPKKIFHLALYITAFSNKYLLILANNLLKLSLFHSWRIIVIFYFCTTIDKFLLLKIIIYGEHWEHAWLCSGFIKGLIWDAREWNQDKLCTRQTPYLCTTFLALELFWPHKNQFFELPWGTYIKGLL